MRTMRICIAAGLALGVSAMHISMAAGQRCLGHRATIVGPNTGSTLAPDAAAILRIT